MSTARHRFDEEDAESLLAALEGIVSAHIVRDDTGRMAEIHVLATPDLHPKQVVRNVESALSAGLGVEVDRRIVSVAQIRTETAGGGAGEGGAPEEEGGAVGTPAPEEEGGVAGRSAPEAPGRVEYVRHEARRDAGRCVCDVVVRSEVGEVKGQGAGPATEAGRAEAAARALFDALALARPEARLELEGAAVSRAGGRTFVIVSAHALLERDSVHLAGAAAVRRSPEEAGILAALQASNRWSQ